MRMNDGQKLVLTLALWGGLLLYVAIAKDYPEIVLCFPLICVILGGVYIGGK